MEQTARKLLVAVITVTCCTCDRISGPFDMNVLEIAQCENRGTEEITFSSTRLNKVSRHSADYTTNITLKIPIDENVSGMFDLQPWGNGGWRPGFLTMDFPNFCKEYKELVPKLFESVVRSAGRDDCPIPVGTYENNLHDFSSLKHNLPELPYGKFKGISKVYKDKGKVLIGCLSFVLDIIPKRQVRRKKKN